MQYVRPIIPRELDNQVNSLQIYYYEYCLIAKKIKHWSVKI